MTFFYDLNKKLKQVLETPKSEHKQLNEGATAESAFQAAIGKKKYGADGMKALQKAGRDGASKATMNRIRDKHDKYDEGIEDRLKDLDPKNPVNIPAYQRKAAEQGRPVKETGGTPMTPKQKKFAALAEPKDKITFADKIAGAKKEVDEMLGDVAAEAMKSALSGHGVNKKKPKEEGWDDMLKDVERRSKQRKVGDISHGAKHDTEEIPGGRRVTRRVDPNTGYSVGTDDDTSADGEKRGRGRPKGSKKAMGAKGPSGKSKLMTKEADHDSAEIKQAMALLKKAGYKVEKAQEELEEKAVSKKQQRFMGMVHAAQKGEKPASKEVAKVAKSMGKKDAEDFAATKHKGLPEKKKPEAKSDVPKKKKQKTEEAGGTGTPTASSGFSFGKGIYDSMNHELEKMIAEGMNVSMSMNTDAAGGPSKSLTVSATDEDAVKLGELLRNAGLGGDGYGGSGYKSACGCGTPDCSCGKEEMDETYGDTTPTENAPDYPTNTETSDDALQYSGGLNKPKSTGQTTVPVIASQEERQETYAEAEEDAIKRMMEMAGIKKKDVEEEKTEEGNLFTGNLAKARAAGKKEADLDGDGDMEKVRESIFTLTNQWKEYKG